MKNKKILIGLAVLCIATITTAILLISSNKPIGSIVENTQPEQTNTDSVKTPGENEVQEIRKDGEKDIPLILNMQETGKIKVITDNKVFFVDLETLISNKSVTGTIGDKIFLENDTATLEVSENSVLYTEKEKKDASEGEKPKEKTDEHSEAGPQTITLEKAIIKKDNKTYINEQALKMVSQIIINDKAVAITTGEIANNNTKTIEEFLFNAQLQECSQEELNKIYNSLINNKENYNMSVLSNTPVNTQAEPLQIVNTIADGINSGKILYSGKVNNSYVVILNQESANAVMSTISKNIYEVDNYTNIRLLINFDEQDNISKIVADTYTAFDNHDIYTYITLEQKR